LFIAFAIVAYFAYRDKAVRGFAGGKDSNRDKGSTSSFYQLRCVRCRSLYRHPKAPPRELQGQRWRPARSDVAESWRGDRTLADRIPPMTMPIMRMPAALVAAVICTPLNLLRLTWQQYWPCARNAEPR